jgi:hypothetical protein
MVVSVMGYIFGSVDRTMSAIIDQMDKPNNREADDREPRVEDDNSDSLSESIDGRYYYDDATGYEVYKEDEDESADYDANRDENKLTTEDTEENKK